MSAPAQQRPPFPAGSVLLTVDEMYRADAAAVAAGIAGETLMENAGRAIADAIAARWQACPAVILCGPGNNGGDGFVTARLLSQAGWPVQVALLGDHQSLKGDARTHADGWSGAVEPLSTDVLEGAELIVDALFGAGLVRPLTGVAADVVAAVAARGIACVAVDVPSGVHGDTGAVLGAAAPADLTVTFFRRKPGHLLFPGRQLCGELVVADIGIPGSAIGDIAPAQAANGPDLWLKGFPWPRFDQHKYSRGHALVVGGSGMTGAARLAAAAARRAGAGVVTILSPPDSLMIYRTSQVGTLVARLDDAEALADRLADPRFHAVLLGPGNGVSPETRANVLAALAEGGPVVLDADALTVFCDAATDLFGAVTGPCLMTPHAGEFVRLFPSVSGAGKLDRARQAAQASGTVVLLKGPDTVIAAPDGRVVVNTNAPPSLATAGSGDVLAGIAVALMAQGMPAFEAGCCAAWLHGEAAAVHGPGLIAEDLPDMLPAVLAALRSRTT
ncbi:MAG: NAD(P)H-hydrate dehydratase [Alphaproteobacteria bacterium]|nr:NAD(P)H-hydrate dehydratase [Alphaproteobacteria bacterium]